MPLRGKSMLFSWIASSWPFQIFQYFRYAFSCIRTDKKYFFAPGKPQPFCSLLGVGQRMVNFGDNADTFPRGNSSDTRRVKGIGLNGAQKKPDHIGFKGKNRQCMPKACCFRIFSGSINDYIMKIYIVFFGM